MTDKMSPPEIIDAVCAEFGVTRDDLLSAKRFNLLVKARIECTRRLLGIGLLPADVGRAINRNFATIKFYMKKI